MKRLFDAAMGLAGCLVAAVTALAAAGPAAADWRNDLRVLRVGFLAGENVVYRRNEVEPFRKYLQSRLGVPIEMVPAVSLPALIDQQVRGDVQYAVETASAFVTAEAMCKCVEPLVTPVSADGTPGVLSVLVVPTAGSIAVLADIRGARIAVARGASIAGRLVPLKALAAAGFEAQKDFRLVEVDSEDAAMRALRDGTADAAIGWTTFAGEPNRGFSRGTLARMVAANVLQMNDIRIIWQSQLIPNGPHVVASDLPGEAKQAILDALLSMSASDTAAVDAIDRGNGGGFTALSAAAYEPLRALVTP